MKRTIFNTPVLTPLLRLMALIGLKLSGWKVKFTITEGQPASFVLIGAPHTSNWDFILMLCTILSLRLTVRWMGKHSLFKPPFKHFMLWMGGIPVNRSASQNLVSGVVEEFNNNPKLIVLIPPEGTRSQVNEWKSGFYHIARMANVPILMAAIDGKEKELRLLGQFDAYQDQEEKISQDIASIKEHYQGLEGVKP